MANDMSVKPGVMFRAPQAPVIYRERFQPTSANLLFLSCGEFEIAAGARSQPVSYPGEESLLYMWPGAACVALDGAAYPMAPYDMLYVPKGKAFSISNPGAETIRMIVTRAPAENVPPVCHYEFARCSKDESRIRRLKGKDVFLMFDVSEKADKLVAGYTFTAAPTRSLGGVTTEAFLAGFGKPLSPRDYGDQVATLLTDPQYESSTAFGIRGETGIQALDK